MMELKELENWILTDLNHYVATHFLTLRDPYFKNPWPLAKRFWYFDDEFLKKKQRKYDLDCFLPPEFLGYWIL